MNVYNIVTNLQQELERDYHFYVIKSDAIVFNFIVDDIDLTGWSVRAEMYDLNTAIRLCTSNVPYAPSAPGIIITDESGGAFSITVPVFATGPFQQYGQFEVAIYDPQGNKYTVLQQLVEFQNERLIWTNFNDQVGEDPGVNPLF